MESASKGRTVNIDAFIDEVVRQRNDALTEIAMLKGEKALLQQQLDKAVAEIRNAVWAGTPTVPTVDEPGRVPDPGTNGGGTH